MASAKLIYDFSAITEDVIIVWFKINSDGTISPAEEGRVVLDNTTGFEKVGWRTIANLDPVVYQFRFYRSSDGTTLETPIPVTLAIDASIYNEIVIERYVYVVDRGNSGTDPGEEWEDPVSGENELTDARLAGATHADTIVNSRGWGDYREDEIEFTPGGGFLFLTAQTFTGTDTYFVTHFKTVAQQVLPTSSSSEYSDIKLLQDDVDNSIDFDATFYKKVCISNFTGPVGTIVFPALALIPDTKVKFQTHQGSQNYLKLQFNSGEEVKFYGEDKNTIYLAKGEETELIFKDHVCYVVMYNGNANCRGLVIGSSRDRSLDGPYLLADESTGVLSEDDYPGLYDFVESLPAGAAVTMAAWATDKTKWALDTTAHTFRVPHLANMHRRFRVDSDEVPGAYEGDAIIQHYHEDGHETTGTGSIFRKGAVHSIQVAAGSGAGNETQSQKSSTNGVITKAEDATYGVDSGSENKVKSVKEIPLIVL